MNLFTSLKNLTHTIKTAPATSGLIFINLVVFIVSITLDNRGLESLSQSSFLINWGADLSALTMSGEYWRLLSSMFLHMNFLHIALNMMALWSLGSILEGKLGSLYFSALYVLSGLAGSLLSAVTHQQMLYLSCGASGAILGLFGVAVLYSIKYPNQDGFSFKNLGLNLLIIFGLGTMANIDNMAHLGGLIIGVLMSASLIWISFSAKNKLRVQIISCVLVTSMIGIIYAQRFDTKMQESLVAAKLDHMLGSLGFKDSAFANSYMMNIDREIDYIIRKDFPENFNPSDYQKTSLDTESLNKLKALNKQDSFIKESMAELDQCQASTDEVSHFFSAPEEQLLWKDIRNYCRVHENAFATITGENTAAFNPKSWIEASSSMENVLQSAALQKILSKNNELADAVISESSCPYTSCKRFK